RPLDQAMSSRGWPAYGCRTPSGVSRMKEVLGAAAVEVAEQIWASVVQVTTNGHGAGAGTIWRSDGIVVTNHHVAPGQTATVVLADTRSYPAHAIARDPANDLAVLKIEARDLPAVAVGDP